MNENPYNHLDEEALRIAYLIAGYIRNTLTEVEHKELDVWINASDHNMKLFEDLTDEKNIEANLAWMDKVHSERSFQALQSSGAFRKQAKRIRLNPVWIAAASVILVLGVFFIYHFAGTDGVKNNELVVADTTSLQPGGNRATLTIADGTIIDLTNAENGRIQKIEGADVSKPAEGELVYDAAASTDRAIRLHTLSTPVGGQFVVRLPDGTKIWLNAASSLTYPSQFSLDERKVELQGEAYFEVAKNDKQPFRVLLAGGEEVAVLGTHFNVMAYHNENAKEITLLEGSVLVNSRDRTQKLNPGMQAKIADGKITRQSGIDTEEIVGWKNGLFVFHDASIETIMRQVERWYGARVVYQGEISQQFNATILRSEPLTKLLRLLELNGYVHFKIENKTIYVLP